MITRNEWLLGIAMCSITGCYGNTEAETPLPSMPTPPPTTAAVNAPGAPLGGVASSSAGANTAAFYGPPRCAAAEVAVCDSFEKPQQSPVDQTLWDVDVSDSNATVSIDDTRAARGAHSLHFHASASGYERAMVVNHTLFPAANNTFFGRVFFYFDGELPGNHFTLFAGVGTLQGASTPTYVRYGGMFGLMLANYVGHGEYQHAGIDDNGEWIDTTPVPIRRWTCMEFEFKGDSNEMHFWLDGVEVPRLAVVGHSNDCCTTVPWTAPQYAKVQIGWESYMASDDPNVTSYDLWMDEAALDTHRIGCTR